MAIDKFVVGRTYLWDKYNTDYVQFVVVAITEDNVYYNYPQWTAFEGKIYSEELDNIDFDAVLVKDVEEPVEEDAVNHPSHYNSDPSGVECIEITRHRNFNIGAAFKYLWRAGLKEDSSLDNLEKEIQDLEKAIFHIKDEISRKRGE